MLTLGFNSTHDCGAALVEDGRIVFAVEEERLTRCKHQGGFPARSLQACLDAHGVDWADVDAVAHYWNPRAGLLRFGWHVLRNLPKSRTFFRRQPGIWSHMSRLPRRMREEFGFEGEFRHVDHHLAHAASCFFPSPFEESAVLTLDGTGEWTTTLMAEGKGTELRVIGRVGYPHSVGKVYEAVTQYLGFRPMSGEGKVMGLAPYGEPRFIELFRRLMRVDRHGRLRVDGRFFEYQYGRGTKYGPRLVAALGPPRRPESELEPRHRDIAASLQLRLEEVALELARRLRVMTGQRRLCVAGGVAFNSVMNGRLLRESGFDEIFVTPAANDSGAGLGAALWVQHVLKGGCERVPYPPPGLGPDFDEAACERALTAAGLRASRPADFLAETARRIARGRIVGWFDGRMEYGPRALGHRSILADPRREDMKDRLNARVKHREGFRPFAPSVLEERAADWFEGARSSPHMLFVFPVKPERRGAIPAACHVDGSARVQTVARITQPRYHALLRAFEAETGVPLLVNTSFNVRGQPIVCTPADAIETFLGTDLDDLALGGFLLSKEDLPNSAMSRRSAVEEPLSR